MIISSNLFENVLVSPVLHGANRLCIVSGYATAAMAFAHLLNAKEKKQNINIHLLVGMCPGDGISVSNHRGFKKLAEDDFPDSFQCSYISKTPAVHSKVYAWLRNDNPILGFAGSANYTQNAFGGKQREAMITCRSKFAFDYYQSLLPDSVCCTHNDVDNLIKIYSDRREKQRMGDTQSLPSHLFGLENVKVSLLTTAGVVPSISGLNWGQRENRDRNQAYIALRSNVYKTNFFPERKVHFTVLTDDEKTMICTRAQDNGKGIHTPHNNALIGEYFRNRLGLSSGAVVTRDHLERYGRTDVAFYKIDDETYYMDFSTT